MTLTKMWSSKESLSPAHDTVTFYQRNRPHMREVAQGHTAKKKRVLNKTGLTELSPSFPGENDSLLIQGVIQLIGEMFNPSDKSQAGGQL